MHDFVTLLRLLYVNHERPPGICIVMSQISTVIKAIRSWEWFDGFGDTRGRGPFRLMRRKVPPRKIWSSCNPTSYGRFGIGRSSLNVDMTFGIRPGCKTFVLRYQSIARGDFLWEGLSALTRSRNAPRYLYAANVMQDGSEDHLAPGSKNKQMNYVGLATRLLRLGCTSPLSPSACRGCESLIESLFCFSSSWFLRIRCSPSLSFFVRSLFFRSLLLPPPPPALSRVSRSWFVVIFSNPRELHIQLPRRRCSVIKIGMVVESQACLHSIKSFEFQKCEAFRNPCIFCFPVSDWLRFDLRKMLAYWLIRCSIW